MDSRPSASLPLWLANISESDPVPLTDVLNGCLYYPAADRDGDPVHYLAGSKQGLDLYSFVYVDYGNAEGEIRRSLQDDKHRFKGYDALFQRNLRLDDLAPRGWSPMYPRQEDGDPARFVNATAKPFALWVVFQRCSDFGEEHGPKRFSLLYICGDGVATYQALFGGSGVSPKVLAIIQPGTGFGLNWTDFTNPGAIFARSVREFSCVPPPFMLYGGWGTGYDPCCWPEYSKLLKRWVDGTGERALWEAAD
jgi:hypothetical protein